MTRQQAGGGDPVVDTYTYDGNGNMTCRTESNQTWVHTYNAENRLSVMEKVTGDCTTPGSTTDTWTFTYDGDGVRVMEEYSGTGDSYTKYFFAGGSYEVIDDGGASPTIKRYYSISGMMVAMKEGDDLFYFAQDHLSSTSIVMDDTGALLSQNRYMPFGEVRDIAGVTNITQTDFGYTGQRNIASMGLMDYDARFYSPTLMRFIQPDTIIVNLQKPQSFNRYSYVMNNPLIFVDPTGHKLIRMDGNQCFETDPTQNKTNHFSTTKLSAEKDIKKTVVIISCGVGEMDQCGNGPATGNETIVAGLRDTAEELGFTVYYTDYDLSGSLKTNQASYILMLMNPGANFLIYLIGHSAGADSTLIALDEFIKQGGDPNRVQGAAILDSTMSAEGVNMKDVEKNVLENYSDVLYGYASFEKETYTLPAVDDEHLRDYEDYYNHMHLSYKEDVIDQIMRDFRWK